MRRLRRRARRAAPAVAPTITLAALGLFPGLPAPIAPAAQAQAPAAQNVVTGTVTAAASQRPIADAQVTVEGTTLGATTDASGRFRIAGVAGGDVRLVVRRIGFQPRTVAARAGQLPVQVALTERALELNQVVVTGTAGAAERRAVGNAVAQVRAAEVVATQPVRNVQDLLTGRAAGVSVVGSSGQVGTGSRIRVRGASSLSLGNDPLIYVDGVRVDNQQASGPQNQSFGSASISRFNDFNPDDIESLEVIKGPAAATLYGTEASNGVVQIITKRGAAGRTTWNFTGRGGANWLPNWDTRLYTNYGAVPRAGGGTALDTVTISPRQLNDSLNARFGNDIFRTGGLQDYQLSLSGGTPAVRYFVSGGYQDSKGVERVNRQTRGNFRVNVTAAPARAVEVQSSLGYTGGRTGLPYESGGGGTTWATYFASPGFLFSGAAPNNPQLGFRSGPPNVYYQAYELFQDVGRFTGSVQATHRPASWFDHRVIFGLDQLDEDNQSRGPRNDFIFTTYPAFSDVGGSDSTAGFLTVSTRAVNYVSADYAANARYALPGLPGWRGVSSVGGQYYGRRTRLRTASVTGFPAAGLVSLSGGLVPSLPADTLTENNTLGGFLQQQLIWRDRLFVTAAVRRDDNSAFGTNYAAVTYPKFSLSYVASEEPALRIPERVFSSLRLRAAYGGAGLQPGAFDAIRSYDAAGGLLTPSNLGNPDLGPERSYESEFGLDAGLFGDRAGLELTYFDGTTRDAILSRQAPPSAGFPGFQLFNAGRVDRRGLEWTARATPVRYDRFSLDVTVNGSVTGYDIRSLANGADTVSLSTSVAHVVGHAPGAWFDRRVVAATKNADGTVPNGSLQCDDGRGGTVPCYTGTALTAPRVFLGNSVPTREGSVTLGASFLRQFRLNAFVDYRGGYKKLDGNRRVRCNLFALCRENYYPAEFDAVALAEAQRGTTFTYNLIQDASFVRFRELSLTYTLPAGLARQLRAGTAALTVAGRNLGLATNYGGLEPEASFNGGTRGGAFGQWEQNVLPQTRSFLATLNLTF